MRYSKLLEALMCSTDLMLISQSPAADVAKKKTKKKKKKQDAYLEFDPGPIPNVKDLIK